MILNDPIKKKRGDAIEKYMYNSNLNVQVKLTKANEEAIQ